MAYFVLPPEFIPKVSTVINFTMSFTPLLSYGSTVLSIRHKRSSQGFSIDICATMLIASILRIVYYINDPFEITLLRQCFVMVTIQTILLHIALKYRSVDEITFEDYVSDWKSHWDLFKETNQAHFKDFMNEIVEMKDDCSLIDLLKSILTEILKFIYNNIIITGGVILQLIKSIIRLFDHHYNRPFKFWQWRDSMTYWKFLGGFILSLSLIQLIFNGNEYLGLILGSMSFLVESSLPLPQILLFQRVKNVDNFKTILLLSWLGGDLTKISYLFYGTDNIGLIFIIAAFFQMSLNLVITYQFFYYRMHPSRSNNESYELLPLRNSRSRADTLDTELDLQLRQEPYRAPSISLSTILPTTTMQSVPLINQHQHYIDRFNGSMNSSISGEVLEEDLADIGTPLSVESNLTVGKRVSVDLGTGIIEEFRSRGNTLK